MEGKSSTLLVIIDTAIDFSAVVQSSTFCSADTVGVGKETQTSDDSWDAASHDPSKVRKMHGSTPNHHQSINTRKCMKDKTTELDKIMIKEINKGTVHI